jgi:hypothetical protein
MPHGPDSQATLHQRITDAVGAVVEPDVELSLADLGLVRGVVVDADRAVVAVAELVPAGPWSTPPPVAQAPRRSASISCS